MKFSILGLCLFISLNSYALLSESQKEIVLTEIDNICGDTWCESDYNYSFDELTQDKDSTTLHFTQLDENDDVSVKTPKTCKLEGFTEFDQMVEVIANSENTYYNLKTEFYDAVNKCF